jgi:hypothetical protein
MDTRWIPDGCWLSYCLCILYVLVTLTALFFLVNWLFSMRETADENANFTMIG